MCAVKTALWAACGCRWARVWCGERTNVIAVCVRVLPKQHGWLREALICDFLLLNRTEAIAICAIKATLWAAVLFVENAPKSLQRVLSKQHWWLCEGANVRFLLLKANGSHCSVCSQNHVVGCVCGCGPASFSSQSTAVIAVRAVLKPHWGLCRGANGRAFVTKAYQSHCSACYRSHIVGCVGCRLASCWW